MIDALTSIEWACKELYTTSDPAVRMQAEKTCTGICERPDCIATCKSLLERGDSCYSQFIAASTLTKYICNRDTVVHVNLRLQLRNFALNYLATRPGLESIVQQALIALICRLTKIGWFDSAENGPEYPFRDIFESVKSFIQSGQISAILVGVKLLSSLVTEICQSTETDLARATFFVRKLLVSFRDLVLFPIFQLGLDLLRQTDVNLKSLTVNDQDQLQVIQHTLALVLACLNYDFVGTAIGCAGDNGSGSPFTSDDMASVQLPAAWRPIFLDTNNVDLFFRLFAGLPQSPASPNLRTLVSDFPAYDSSRPLSCLVQITSIRRTLFTNDERQNFLNPLMVGCLEVLRRRDSLLCDPTVYHEFCRLLSRMKITFQVGELMQVSVYPEFIKLVTDLTTHSLYNFSDDSEFNNSNSLHYLLALWQRLVASIPYVRTSQPYLIDTYAPQVTRAYIESRLAGVPRYVESGSKVKPLRVIKKAAANGAGADKAGDQYSPDLVVGAGDGASCPLDDTMTLTQQLDQFSIIGRCDYANTCELIVRLFDQSFGQLQSTLQQLVSVDPAAFVTSTLAAASEQAQAIRLEDNRLAWLVYMIGALINGRSTSSTGGLVDSDQLDGELIARVLRLLQFGDACVRLLLQLLSQDSQSTSNDVASMFIHISSGTIIRLELAIITFLERFRRIYVGENISRASKMYRALSDLVGISDEQTILQIFIGKILLNLRYWSDQEVVLEPTLKLFGELASSFTAMRKLLQLDDVKFMLANHTSANFRFLSSTSNLALSRYRPEFYAYLSRLMLVTLSGTGADDNRPFLDFLSPLTQVANTLISNLLLSENCSISPDEARSSIIGLARDLAGVAFSLNTMASFQHFLDWFYPSLFSLFGRALELWPFDPLVTCPVLKLLAEIVHNRNDRLKFDGTIPMGYLLLAEMTKILINFSTQLIPFCSQITEQNLYSHKVKPLTRYLNALRITLSGKYANFAIFGLVGDGSFEKTVKLSADVLLCVTEDELRGFIKLSKAYFALLECLTQNHMVLISSLDASVIRRFFNAIVIGVDSLDASVAWSACACLDYILTHIYNVTNPHSSSQSNSTNDVTTNHISTNDNEMLNGQKQLIVTFLSSFMNEECKNQWSISRPLLALILLNQDYYTNLQRLVLNAVSPHQRPELEGIFGKLMENVDNNLYAKNRDKFTQNISAFRHALMEFMKTVSVKLMGNQEATAANYETSETLSLIKKWSSILSLPLFLLFTYIKNCHVNKWFLVPLHRTTGHMFVRRPQDRLPRCRLKTDHRGWNRYWRLHLQPSLERLYYPDVLLLSLLPPYYTVRYSDSTKCFIIIIMRASSMFQLG
ncbi:Exportin-7 [Echinococcus granulosus]|uniref:Exportin-7 n=1 Tax=Echinococcus granulosus TaxID=6210 RepID=W6U5C6_ECHGR|nr:Exportin-7 [Echinococcus granulosus]EUB56335.1 Exportin-7 [Echinococcus granulosus]